MMTKPFLLAFFASAAIGLSAQAQTFTIIDPTTLNGGFESATPALTAPHKQGWDGTPDISNWTNTNTTYSSPTSLGTAGGTYNDNGVDYNTGGQHGGLAFSFFHGGEGGAFNLSAFKLQAGDQISLSWYGRADTIYFGVIASTDGTFANSNVLTSFTQLQTAGVYTQYGTNIVGTTQFSAPYTVTAADAGKFVGLDIFASATGYANVDDITLTVTRAVPEPSTYALLFAGLGGLLVVLRVRRSIA